jgi:hypothetical protein
MERDCSADFGSSSSEQAICFSGFIAALALAAAAGNSAMAASGENEHLCHRYHSFEK